MHNDLTTAVHRYLTTAPASAFAQQPVEMGEHWQGSDNLLWRASCRGSEAVVKLYLDAGQARSRRQFDAHTIFAPLGLAPTPLWYDHTPEGLPREVNIYTWVEGASLDVEVGALPDLAHAIAAIHTSDPRDLQRLSPHPINLEFFWRIEQSSMAAVHNWLSQAKLDTPAQVYAQLSRAASDLVEQALPLWNSAHPTPVHGDLRLEHAIGARAGICLVDWDYAGLGDPALDIAQFLQRSRTVTGVDALASWVDRYLAAVDNLGLEQRIAAYNSLLPLHAATYLLLGLHQHASPGVPSDLLESLPFITDTLAASLSLAAVSLSVVHPDETVELAHQVAAYLSS